MDHPQARMLVFAKAPVQGRVKTRLIPALGPHGAARLYRELVRRTLVYATIDPICPISLYCEPNTGHGFFHTCRRDYGVRLRRQQGADLGERMHRALSEALYNAEWAVLIGGDCVSLDREQLHWSVAELAKGRDAVLGPTEDGGYWLIGLRKPCAMLFRGPVWGTATVLEATRRRLRRAGLDWRELPVGRDLDRPSDLRRYRGSVESPRIPS
jgi:rSAM/selenodomain-associated transferase 1